MAALSIRLCIIISAPLTRDCTPVRAAFYNIIPCFVNLSIGRRKEEDLPAPAARFIRYFSRQGRQGAKDAKGEERVTVRQIFVEHDDPDSATLHPRTTTLSLFPLRPLRLSVKNSE